MLKLMLLYGFTMIMLSNSTADLRIKSGYVKLQGANGENMLIGNQNGSVEAYYDNSVKLATSNTGVTITGNATATKFLGDGSALTGVGGDMDITSCLFV